MVGHGQICVQQGEQRAHKSFGSAMGQMEHLSDRQHRFYGGVTVDELGAPLVVPAFEGIFRDPQGDGTPLDQGFIVSRPVANTVYCFAAYAGYGSFLAHTPK